MSNLVTAFTNHFLAQQRGRIPYQKGFILVGALPKPARHEAAPSRTNMALASISAGTAARDNIAQMVGNGKPIYIHKYNTGGASKNHRKTSSKKHPKRAHTKSSTRPRKEAL